MFVHRVPAMQLDVDVLVTGHTHQNGVLEYEGKFFVNPGSITGAYSPLKTWVPAPIGPYIFSRSICLIPFFGVTPVKGGEYW